MNALRRQLRSCTWLALVAMLALALLPALSHAFAGAAPGGAAEVCTAQGLQLVAADGSDAGKRIAHASPHCPYCTLGAAAMGLPPAVAAALPAGPRDAPPALLLHAPRTVFTWAAAQPRGPPERS